MEVSADTLAICATFCSQAHKECQKQWFGVSVLGIVLFYATLSVKLWSEEISHRLSANRFLQQWLAANT